MNDFSRSFLNEDWKALPDAPRVFLSAFGKHPAWNDHMDDIGLVTPSLVEARRIIYGGIAQQIESAAWEKGGAEKFSGGYDHLVQWTRPGESLTGLLWSSSDGKGRSLYPMVLLSHCIGRPADWISSQLVPVLEEAAAKCRDVTSAERVVGILNEAQQQLRAQALEESVSNSQVGVAEWGAFIAQDPVGLQRVLHHLRGNLGVFAPGCEEWCAGEKQARSCSLRLPQVPGLKPAGSLNAWLSFFATQLDCSVPMFGLLPLDGNWIDVIVGEPSPADFFVLRALPSAVPLITDIPYQLDSEMLAGWAGLITEVSAGRMPSISCFNGIAVLENRSSATKWLARYRPSARPGFFSRLLRPGGG